MQTLVQRNGLDLSCTTACKPSTSTPAFVTDAGDENRHVLLGHHQKSVPSWGPGGKCKRYVLLYYADFIKNSLSQASKRFADGDMDRRRISNFPCIRSP